MDWQLVRSAAAAPLVWPAVEGAAAGRVPVGQGRAGRGRTGHGREAVDSRLQQAAAVYHLAARPRCRTPQQHQPSPDAKALRAQGTSRAQRTLQVGQRPLILVRGRRPLLGAVQLVALRLELGGGVAGVLLLGAHLAGRSAGVRGNVLGAHVLHGLAPLAHLLRGHVLRRCGGCR